MPQPSRPTSGTLPPSLREHGRPARIASPMRAGCPRSFKKTVVRSQSGFSLVELLVVTLIMAVGMGLVMVALGGMHRTGLQTATSQVASGFSLARQLAISKNAPAAFVIATDTNDGPSQPFKYWAVVVSNRATTNWILQKDWERLPEGAVFLEVLGVSTDPKFSYNTINNNPFTGEVVIGTPFTPANFINPTNFGSVVVVNGTNQTSISFPSAPMPAITFLPEGGSTVDGTAVRLADGTVDGSGKVILRNTNRWFFVETDTNMGRVRVRAPESFR